MARNLQLSYDAANAQADAIAAALNSGYLRVYDGTQPANADTAITTQNLLAELRFQATAAPAAVNGMVTFNTLVPDSQAANGTASWFRCLASDGTTVIFDGEIAESPGVADLVLSETALTTQVALVVSSFTYTVERA